jgi:putative SOS response-associated peptidase YedK
MPAILGPHDVAAWLDPEAPRASLLRLLSPCPADWLVASPVSRRVNDVRNDDPALVEALPEAG